MFVSSTSFIILTFSALGVGQDANCRIHGRCQGSATGVVDQNDYNSCLVSCQASSECEWFTQFPETSNCVHFSTCNINGNTTWSVLSGKRDCDISNLMCNEHGACFGHALDSRPAQSKDDCNRLCNLADGCSWFTFYPSNGQCMMINDPQCLIVDTSCTDCKHGQKYC